MFYYVEEIKTRHFIPGLSVILPPTNVESSSKFYLPIGFFEQFLVIEVIKSSKALKKLIR